MVDDATKERPVRVEGIDEAETLARDLVVAVGVLLGVGDEDLAAEIRDPEGSVPPGKLGIDECPGPRDEVEATVEDVHPAVVEVGRVQRVLRRRDREALVDRAHVRPVDRDHRVGERHGRAPAEDLALLGVEQET